MQIGVVMLINYVWNTQLEMNLKTFHFTFKSRLIDIFKQNWYDDVDKSSLLSTYIYIKNEHALEHYMNILPNQLRIYISRIRISSHALRIETGRYGVNRVDRNQRLCLICN